MRARSVIAVVVASLAISRTALAGGSDSDSDLEAALAEPIVTTASHDAETQSVAPATIVTITSDDIRRYGIHTIDEAINFLGAGLVTSSTMTNVEVGARGVQITGDYGNHMLLLVNGHMVNEPIAGTAYFERGAGIPMELVDHIEIIVGPGSVLYGSNAMLGVINVVTKRAKDYDGVHVIAEGSLLPSLTSNNELATPSFSSGYTHDLGSSYRLALGYGKEFTLFGQRAEITGQVEYFAQNGPGYYLGPETYGNDAVTGRPRIFTTQSSTPPPGVWGGDFRNDMFITAPAGHVRMIVGNWELNVRGNIYDRGLPTSEAVDFGNPNDHERDRFLSADLRYTRPLSRIADLSVRLYADGYDYLYQALLPAAESCLVGEVKGCNDRYVDLSQWAGSEIQLTFDYFNDGRLRTLVGADGRYRHVATTTDYVDVATGLNPGSVGAFSVDDEVLAVYGQQEYSPVSWLALNAGVRADFEEGFAHATPRLAASVKPWTGGTIKAIYSEGFRAPSAYERFTYDPTYQLSAPGLRPETEQSAELSLEQREGTHRWTIGVFRSWWHDLISLQPLSDAQLSAAIAQGQLVPGTTAGYVNQNIASIDSFGFQLSFDGSIGVDQLRYGLNFTAAKSSTNPGGGAPETPIPIAPTLFGNARVAYTFGAKLPTVAVAGQLVGKRPVSNAFGGSFPVQYAAPYEQVQGTVSGPFPGIEGLSYRTSLSYAAPVQSAYTVGPLTAATAAQPYQELAINQRMQAWLGFEYVFH